MEPKRIDENNYRISDGLDQYILSLIATIPVDAKGGKETVSMALLTRIPAPGHPRDPSPFGMVLQRHMDTRRMLQELAEAVRQEHGKDFHAVFEDIRLDMGQR